MSSIWITAIVKRKAAAAQGPHRAAQPLPLAGQSLLPCSSAMRIRPASGTGKYNVALSKGSASDSKSIPMTVNEAVVHTVTFNLNGGTRTGSGNLTRVSGVRYEAKSGAVVFETTHFSYYAAGYVKIQFSDVLPGAWYFDAVSFIAEKGVTNGTSATAFSPDATLTRGQFITMLMRAYKIAPDENPFDSFSDAGSTYYTGYLAAAKRLGISNGVGNNSFAPEQAITRQEMFVMLYNALRAFNQLPTGDTDKKLSDSTDASAVADSTGAV